jgi:hypothetical protein
MYMLRRENYGKGIGPEAPDTVIVAAGRLALSPLTIPPSIWVRPIVSLFCPSYSTVFHSTLFQIPQNIQFVEDNVGSGHGDSRNSVYLSRPKSNLGTLMYPDVIQ